MKRICYLIFVCFFCLSLCPYSAATEYTSVSSFLSWMAGKGGLAQKIAGYIPGSGCPDSVDGRHHASSFVEDRENGYFTCICNDCGDIFKAYAEDLEEAESEYVASLPATVVDSNGGLVWYPTIEDLYDGTLSIFAAYYNVNILLSESNDYSGSARSSYGYLEGSKVDDRTFLLTRRYAENNYDEIYAGFATLNFKAPVTGQYSRFGVLHKSDHGNKDYTTVNISCAEGNVLNSACINGSYSWCNSFVGYLYFPCFRIIPIFPYDVTSNNKTQTYNIGTRAASIAGNYGVVNSGGTVTQIESQSIVNEGQHTVYNPVTNETENFTDWNYDYSTRTYTLTQEGGDTTTVTYGDEFVTYSSGGNTTNIYYITNTTSENGGNGGESGGGGNTPVNPPHQHQYSSVVTIEPTCTRSGVRTFTCAGCGASYTENIPAVGHAWEVAQDVKTQYDTETGELLHAGYTVYECNICGQQYRSDDESLPPGIIGQNTEVMEIGDNGQSLVSSMTGMYEGYLALLAATFPYIPDDIKKLFSFGVTSVISVGIYKGLRR